MLKLRIITPNKIVDEKEVDSVTLPTVDGEITVLPHHASLFTQLGEGILKIRIKEAEDYLAIGGGYAETNGQDINILVSRAYRQDEIDEKMTETAVAEAKKILQESKDAGQRKQANAILRRSLIDSRLVKRRKSRPA